MSTTHYEMFPNEMYMLKYFGQYLPLLDVSASSRLPFYFYIYDGKPCPRRNFQEFLTDMEDYANLGIDIRASRMAGFHFVVFFKEKPRAPAPVVVEPIKISDSITLDIITDLPPVVQETVEVQEEIKEEVKPEVVEKEVREDLAEIIAEAEALYKDSDKRGSKAALEKFATSKGVSLNKGGTFESMMTEFKAAL